MIYISTLALTALWPHHLDVVQGRVLGHELVVDLAGRGGHFSALVVVASAPPAATKQSRGRETNSKRTFNRNTCHPLYKPGRKHIGRMTQTESTHDLKINFGVSIHNREEGVDYLRQLSRCRGQRTQTFEGPRGMTSTWGGGGEDGGIDARSLTKIIENQCIYIQYVSYAGVFFILGRQFIKKKKTVHERTCVCCIAENTAMKFGRAGRPHEKNPYRIFSSRSDKSALTGTWSTHGCRRGKYHMLSATHRDVTYA